MFAAFLDLGHGGGEEALIQRIEGTGERWQARQRRVRFPGRHAACGMDLAPGRVALATGDPLPNFPPGLSRLTPIRAAIAMAS